MSSAISPAAEAFQVRVHVPAPSVVVLRPEGPLDMVTAPDLAIRIEFHLGCCRHAVVDLREVDFVDPAALPTLVELHATARSAGLGLHFTGGDDEAVGQVLASSEPALPVSRTSAEELVAALAHPRRRSGV